MTLLDNSTARVTDLNQRHGERRSTVNNLLRSSYKWRTGFTVNNAPIHTDDPLATRSMVFHAPDNMKLLAMGFMINSNVFDHSDSILRLIQDDEKSEFFNYEEIEIDIGSDTGGRKNVREDFAGRNITLFKDVRYRLEFIGTNAGAQIETAQAMLAAEVFLRRT